MPISRASLENRTAELKRPINIGSLLLEAGKLKAQDLELIEDFRKRQGLEFGEAAVKLGLVAKTDVLQILAQQFDYPYLQVGESRLSKTLVAAYQPFSQQAEILRGLRSQLMLRWFNQGHKQLALVGASSNVGCSFLAANLAIGFSQLGMRTLLIDGNLRNPGQHQLFGLTQHQGLADFLAGRAEMETISEIPSFPNLSVLPAGTVPPNPQELLGQPAFKALIGDLAKNFNVILVDTPNGMLYADTQIIAAHTSAALLVMRRHHSRMDDARKMQIQLADAKAHIVGTVLNQF
jgi:chain length determinant protein tyrosine kinase EpsG